MIREEKSWWYCVFLQEIWHSYKHICCCLHLWTCCLNGSNFRVRRCANYLTFFSAVLLALWPSIYTQNCICVLDDKSLTHSWIAKFKLMVTICKYTISVIAFPPNVYVIKIWSCVFFHPMISKKISVIVKSRNTNFLPCT